MKKNIDFLVLLIVLPLVLSACFGRNAVNEGVDNKDGPNNNAVVNNRDQDEMSTEKVLDNLEPATEVISDLAPSFIVRTFQGEEITLDEMAGKVVVLNFWASWCKPCEEEAPILQAAWEIYQDRGDVLFIGLAYVDSDEATAEYIEKFELTFPTGHEIETQVAQIFRITGIPETYIIDSDGTLDHTQIGPFASVDEIIVIVNELLGP